MRAPSGQKGQNNKAQWQRPGCPRQRLVGRALASRLPRAGHASARRSPAGSGATPRKRYEMLLDVTNFRKSPLPPNRVSQPAARLCVAHARGGGKVVVTSSNDEGYSPFQSHGPPSLFLAVDLHSDRRPERPKQQSPAASPWVCPVHRPGCPVQRPGCLRKLQIGKCG